MTGRTGGPAGIALDVSGGKVYWTEGTGHKIVRADLDGSNVQELITTGLNGPRGIALGAHSPTFVDLVFFRAEQDDDDNYILLTWKTVMELDNVGFFLWRSNSTDGPYTRIVDNLIPAEGLGIMGAEYSYEDMHVEQGTTYWYKLEDIDLHGVSTFHGPVQVVVPLGPHCGTMPNGAGFCIFSLLLLPAATVPWWLSRC